MGRQALLAALIVTWLGVGVTTLAGPDVQARPPDPPKGFRTFDDPGKRFSLDYPRDWQVIPGARDVVVTLAERQLKAVIVVERRIVPDGAPETIDDTWTNIVVSELRARQPDAQNIVPSRSKERPRVVIVDYTRTGTSGPEQLRQYSFAEGTLVLRVTCVAPAKEFKGQLAAFVAVANTVRISRAPADGSLEFF